MATDATATIRIHHAELDRKTLLGRGIGVNRLPVASLPAAQDITEITVPAGTHILQIRNGIFFSSALRYSAAPGAVLDYEAIPHEPTWGESVFGSGVALRRIPAPVPAVDRGDGAHLADHVARAVFVAQ